MKKIEADVVIIGSGTAGMKAYRMARRKTNQVLMVEGDHFGTTCARVGCMPSKLLISAANTAHAANNTAPFGVHVKEVGVNGKEVMDRVKKERDRFVNFILDDVNDFTAEGGTVRGWARFIDPYTVRIDDHMEIKSKAFVIATGSRPNFLPEWENLGDLVQTSDDMFFWDDLPKRVGILGSGIIGMELGQALSRLQVEVSIYNRGDTLVGIRDPKVLQEAWKVFKEELDIYGKTQTQLARSDGGKIKVRYIQAGQPRVQDKEFDVILAAIGRKPNIEHLDLGTTGMELDHSGVPIYNPVTQQTSIPHIFIAGDARGGLLELHMASDEGHTAGMNAASYPEVKPGLRRSRLSIAFTNPQIMMVGSSFNALDKGSIVIGEVSFRNQGRSRVMLKNKGLLRTYFDKKTRLLLGAEGIGPDLEHLGHLLAWAHQSRLTADEMLDRVYYHPVVEEGLRTALLRAQEQF